MRPDIRVERFEFFFHDLAKISESRYAPPAKITSEAACDDAEGGGGIGDPIGNSHLGIVLGFPGLLDLAGQHSGGLGELGRRFGGVDGLVTGRRADWGRHERIPSKDRGGGGAEAGARPIDLYDAALFGGIAGEEAALSRRAHAWVEAGDHVWEMETLVGSMGADWLGIGRGGRGYGHLLDRVVADGVGRARTRFKLGRSHGDEDGQKHE